MVHWMLAFAVGATTWALRGMYRQGFQWNFGGAEGVTFAVPPSGAGTGPTTVLQQYYQQTGVNNQQQIIVKKDDIAGVDTGSSTSVQDTIDAGVGDIRRKIAGYIGL
ncbi:hypothetical protein SVAN01_09373 [Stagonosporopsis vannaccii]|nr:hypothetical protein SVAN01_09373 [Stagonosporopsis vannaccii]